MNCNHRELSWFCSILRTFGVNIFDRIIFAYILFLFRLFHSYGKASPEISEKLEYDIYFSGNMTFFVRDYLDQSHNELC